MLIQFFNNIKEEYKIGAIKLVFKIYQTIPNYLIKVVLKMHTNISEQIYFNMYPIRLTKRDTSSPQRDEPRFESSLGEMPTMSAHQYLK